MSEFDLQKYIGGKIKYYRNKLNMTQDDLAKKLKTTKATISNYETGYRTPKQDSLFDLANALQISIDDLFPPTQTRKRDSKIISIFNQLNPELQELLLKEAKSHLQQQNEKQTSSKVVPMEDKQEERKHQTLAAHDPNEDRIITKEDIDNIHDVLDELDAEYDKKNNKYK